MPQLVPTEQPRILIAAHHLAPAGVYDHAGHELTHAHVMLHYKHLLGDQLATLAEQHHALAQAATKHAKRPDHAIHRLAQQAHADLAEAAQGRLHGNWRIDRFDAPIEWYAAQEMGVKESEIADFQTLSEAVRVAADRRMKADKKADTSTWQDDATLTNLFLTGGVTALWQIAEGNASATNSGGSAAGTYAIYNNTQARIGVGDSTTAAAAGQTDLQASTNKAYVGMDATYPTQSTNQTILRATYGTSAGNFSWQEFVSDNCNGSSSTATTRIGGTTLDRVVSNQGSKVTGQTWQPSLTLSIS